jgi:AraC family transcriptional regulator, arabinose operon regulatory protein
VRAGSPTIVDTPSKDVESTGLWVTACGHHASDASYQLPSRITSECIVILTLGGSGWVRLGDRTATVEVDDLVLLPPRVSHGYGTGPGGEWDLLWAHVNGPAVAPLLTFCPGQGVTVALRTGRAEELTRLLSSALVEMTDRRDGYEIAAAGYVDQAIRLAIVDARRGPERAPERAVAIARDVQDYVQAHLGAAFALTDIADSVHLSPAYLCRVFKATTGFSPLEYATKQRLNRAKHLLHATDLPVATIAHQVGYDDAGYFTRVFRATTGTNPSAFRRVYQWDDAGGSR